MPNMSPRNVMRLAAVVVAVALSVGFLAGRAAFAEEVPGDAGKGKSASAESISGGKVTEAERLKFQQSAAAAQMQELQDRMFRLAELTR